MPPRDLPGQFYDPEADRGKTGDHDTPDIIMEGNSVIRPSGGPTPEIQVDASEPYTGGYDSHEGDSDALSDD